MKKRSPSRARLLKAQRDAAKELRLPLDSWQVKRFALLVIAHTNITERLSNGADVNISNLLLIDTQMAEIKASAPQETLKVEIEIVGRDNPEPEPPPTLPLPPTPPNDSDDKPPAALPAGDNVVPLHPPPAAKTPLHELPGNAPPIKRAAAYYESGYVTPTINGHANPFSVRGEPRPNFESVHGLPSVPGPRRSGSGGGGSNNGSVCW